MTVCYYMKDGSERYRTYPLDRAGFESFSSVFETEEYKEIAFQAPDADKAGKARFSWNDGVKERAMKVTEDEKEALVQAYREDRTEMKMADLSGEFFYNRKKFLSVMIHADMLRIIQGRLNKCCLVNYFISNFTYLFLYASS